MSSHKEKANILIAYPYLNATATDLIARNQEHIRFLLDSGAFTAWRSGKPIALDEYCRFIEGLPFKPWRYFALDVIGDPAGTLRNYEVMLERGFTPVPIFTRGEDPSVLEDYYKTSDVVGIGGLVGTPGNRGFVNGLMQRVGGRRAHWLGFTDMSFLKAYRPYMTDSSRWEAGGRFGAIALYMGRGVIRTLEKRDFRTRPPSDVLARLRALGFDPYALAKLENWHGGLSISRKVSAASAQALSLDIERQLGTLYFNSIADTGRGTRFFLEAFLKQRRT